jgi:hypothetical protein
MQVEVLKEDYGGDGRAWLSQMVVEDVVKGDTTPIHAPERQQSRKWPKVTTVCPHTKLTVRRASRYQGEGSAEEESGDGGDGRGSRGKQRIESQARNKGIKRRWVQRGMGMGGEGGKYE